MNYEQEIEQIEKEVITTIWADYGGRHQEERINPCGDGGCENGGAIEDLLTLTKKMQEEIKELKTIESGYLEWFEKHQWIPCSERLPEKFGCYLVTAKRNGKIMPRTYECHYTPIGKQWDYLRDDKGYVFGAEIIAWMITPIPYNL